MNDPMKSLLNNKQAKGKKKNCIGFILEWKGKEWLELACPGYRELTEIFQSHEPAVKHGHY